MSEPFDPYHRWLGIPLEEQPPNHYRLLGIGLFEDQPEVIEHAADRQMAHLRTFQVGPHAALSQKLLNEVAAAKLCLLKAEKKAAYDGFLRDRLASSGTTPAPASQQGAPPPLPVAPPDEEPPVVELNVPGEESADATSASRNRRWMAVGAGVAAVGLVLGIVALAAMLAFPPAPPSTDEPLVAAFGQRKVDDLQPSTAFPPVVPSPSADDEMTEEELAFWESLLQAESEDIEATAATPPKPKPPDTAAPGPPATAPPKAEPKASTSPSEAPNTAVAMPKPPVASTPPKRPEPKPEPFKTVAQLDPLVAEAWAMIRRGDHVKGRDKLVQAGKVNREDLRVPFSLGLVDALVTLDWNAAEKEFLQCVQEHPKHAASLNNLALVRLRLNRETLSVRHWRTVLAEGPPPGEVIQNLGRVRYLLQKARLSFKPVTQKDVSSLFVDAQVAGDARFDEGVGFLYMGLYGGGNPEFGWTQRHDYEDRWCVVCNARGTTKCPQRDCDHGKVTRMSSKVVALHPITKAPIYQSGPTRVPCTVCNESGFISCPHCRDGKDRQLK